MLVNLGSVEVDDDTRRLIRRHVHRLSGLATRVEVREFAINAFCEAIEIAEQIEADRHGV